MIVSVTIADNRESEIGDAIRSVVSQVDRVLLVDTGISDNTADVAREIAGEKFSLVKRPWSDFSDARNTAIEEAIKLGAEWIVIVDTDERLHLRGIDLRAGLSKAKSDILSFESDDGHYPKDKILRATSSARFIGPTHETLVGGSREPLEGATFSELPKTTAQLKRKFARDMRLLLDYVAKHPNDPRWWYYLGASYEGIAELAANAFGQCVVGRKQGEEAAWSAYKQAEQYLKIEDFENAIRSAALGIGANATSAECAYVAARAAQKMGRFDQAVAWARIAEAVGRYKGCGSTRSFFRHLPAHYELPYEILAQTLPNEKLRLEAKVNLHEAKQARELAVAAEYLDKLSALDLDLMSVSIESSAPHRRGARLRLRPPLLGSLCSKTTFKRIRFDPPNGWHPTNPNICWHHGEIWCVVRTVNYWMQGRKYHVQDPDGVVRTENYLGILEGEELTNATLMYDLDQAPRQKSNVVGYEDVRLASIDGTLFGSATVCDRDASRRQIAKLTLNPSGDVVRADVQPSNQLHEKNWMPLDVDGRFTYIYSLDPTAILPGPLRDCPFALEHLKGGAATEYEDGYLCITHETVDTPEGRLYFHRFVKLDAKFNVTAVSRAFVFAHYGIEFAAGLIVDGDEIVVSYGVDDREAWIARIDATDVEEMEWFLP